MRIYHIVIPEIWEEVKEMEFYEAESLRTEGFTHCSSAKQLDGVLERYYASSKRVIILEIETEKLTSKLVNEPSTNGEIYPHIYGRINSDSIVNAVERNVSFGE